MPRRRPAVPVTRPPHADPEARQVAQVLADALEHQTRKAASLRGREGEVREALAVRWERVHRRLLRAGLEHADPRLLQVGSGAQGVVFGSRSARAVGVDPLALPYAQLFPAWQGNVPTVAAVGERLPFADGTFDAVIFDSVLDQCRQPAGVLAEMGRVLAPGGMLYFTANVHHPIYSVAGRAKRAWKAPGVRLETAHLTSGAARELLAALPLDVCSERTYIGEAKERARRRGPRRPRHLLPMLFFRNAQYQLVARRR